MRHLITIQPAETQWAVRRDGSEPWMFASGAQAEWAARRLGDALAGSGAAVELRIMLRGGGFGGRFVWEPATPAGTVRVTRQLEPA